MNSSTPATYGGSNWLPRSGRLEDELRTGDGWAALGCDSDCTRLTDVLLYRPGAGVAGLAPEEIDRALHLRPVDAARLGRQVDGLARAYESLGVRVHFLHEAGVDDRRHPNAIFLRDVFWATPSGAIVARMASAVRAGEERAVAARLAELGMPIALTVAGDGTLEGADCLWLRPGLALVGLGPRTNEAGMRQVRERLEALGHACLTTRHDPYGQHLTGAVQPVSHERVLVRSKMLPPETIPILRKSGFEVVACRDTEEIVAHYAFNFVVVEPDVVLLPAGCPEFRAVLERAGVRVAAEVEVGEYLAMAGGPCCATGVLARERAA